MIDFNKINEQLDSIIHNEDGMPKHELFRNLCELRDRVLKDLETNEKCQTDQLLIKMRQAALDRIYERQKNIIDNITEAPPKAKIDSAVEIPNFPEAREALMALIIDEIENNESLDPSVHGLLQSSEEYKKYLETVKKVKASCEGDHYSILLVGEFESGKTTTLDALCGGYHIGAIGKGVPTSSIPISVSYGEKNAAFIEWKTDDQLLGFLKTHLGHHFDDFDLNSFDVEDKEKREMWQGKIDLLRNSKVFITKAITPGATTELKHLMLCSLILRFYKSKDLIHVKEMYNPVPASVIHKISKFPKNFRLRWIKDGSNAFSIEESLFIFIKLIRYNCNSTTLKESNCTFIDCPGLFNSKYDTEVTLSLMSDANAILYILPYERSVNQGICKSLYTLKERFPDFQRKLVIANNLNYAEENSKYILEENVSEIKTLFGENMDVIPYDARLAYLGYIKMTYDLGLLDEESQRAFVGDENKSFEEVWKRRIRQYIDVFQLDTPVQPHVLVEKSGAGNLVQRIREFAEYNKAYSMIVSDGVKPVLDSLDDLRSTMSLRHIEPYIQDDKKLTQLWDKRIQIAKEFAESTKKVIEDGFNNGHNGQKSLRERLAESAYKNIFTDDVYKEIAFDISDTIYDNLLTVYKLRKKEKELRDYITPMIQGSINYIIGRHVSRWNEEMDSNENDDFNNIFPQEVDKLNSNLKEEWKSRFNRPEDTMFKTMMQKYYYIPNDSRHFLIGNDEYGASDIPITSKGITSTIVSQILMATTTIVLLIAGYLTFLVSSAAAGGTIVVVGGPLAWLAAALALAAGGIAIGILGDSALHEKFNQKMTEKLLKEFEEKNLNSNGKQESIKDRFFAVIRSTIYSMCDNFINGIKLDEGRMENDKKAAINSPDNEKENKCKEAIRSIEFINEQISKYEEYIKKFVADRKND